MPKVNPSPIPPRPRPPGGGNSISPMPGLPGDFQIPTNPSKPPKLPPGQMVQNPTPLPPIGGPLGPRPNSTSRQFSRFF